MDWKKEDSRERLLSLIDTENSIRETLTEAYREAITFIKEDADLDAKTKALHMIKLKKDFDAALAPASGTLQAIDMLNKMSNLYGENLSDYKAVVFMNEDKIPE